LVNLEKHYCKICCLLCGLHILKSCRLQEMIKKKEFEIQVLKATIDEQNETIDELEDEIRWIQVSLASVQ